MKLLTAAAVIALASATAAFAQPATSSPTNLNAANQSSGSSISGQDMQGQAATPRPAKQGATNSAGAAAKPVATDINPGIGSATTDKVSNARLPMGANEDLGERSKTRQLNEQQLGRGGMTIGSDLPGAASPQTAAKPPEDRNLNCIENPRACSPAAPPRDH